MLQQLYRNIQKMTNTWNVPCLGGDFTSDQLRSMDVGIWQYITQEMIQNPGFLLAFHDKVHWNWIQREAEQNPLSEYIIGELNQYLDLKTIDYTNLSKEFIRLFNAHNRFDSKKIKAMYPELYEQIYVCQTVPSSISSVVVPVVRSVGVKGQAGKSQATEEERKLAKEEHGITDIIPHEKEEQVALNEGELQMRGYVKGHIYKTTRTLNVDPSSRYAKYADILPNSIPAKTDKNMSQLEGMSSELNLSRVWPFDGVWIPENKVGERVIFMIESYDVPIELVKANAIICARQGSFISRSKYLTEDIIMLLGPWLDWTQVNPILYTPEIIRKFIGQVNLKHVVMRTDAAMFQNMPEIVAYKSRADAIIIEYLEQKVELQEKMTRERFVQTRAPPISLTRKGLEQSFEDDFRNQMFDDNDDDDDDSLTLLARAHERAQSSQGQL